MDVPERMEAFLVRKDRAEVMAIAAVVFVTLGRWLNLQSVLVPGVGVKEGVLSDVLSSLHARERVRLQEADLVSSARSFAARLGYDARHCEKVRELAANLFDQLRPLHGLGDGLRSLLEAGALLHDIGHSVRRESHHKIGEYLVANGDIPGLSGAARDIVACLVRYHSDSEPDIGHKVYASLAASQQRQVRALVPLLRLADRLDSDHRQTVSDIRVRTTPRNVLLDLKMKRSSDLILWSVQRGASLFEEEFGLKVSPSRVS
jgi:exopolyphosphatase/guanosine-5'-triphosphate,3'-diphosphate pyrophosphatase